jgi:hypothetical protein
VNMQVTMTCGGVGEPHHGGFGRERPILEHPGSLREWISSRVPPGREGALRQRDFFSNRRSTEALEVHID